MLALRQHAFVVHGYLWTVNGERSLNHFTRAKRVKEWREAARSVALHPSNSAGVPFRHVHVDAEIFQHRGPLGDAGGHAPTVKAVLDGLVDAGVIDGDSGSFVEKISFYAPYRTGEKAHIRITLTEVA